MSLEAAIERNTAAIEKLIAALTTAPEPSALPPSGGERIMDKVNLSPGAVNEAPDPPKTRRTKKEAAPEAPAGEPAPEASAPSPEPTAPDAPATAGAATATSPAATYKDVTAAAVALIKACGSDKTQAQKIIQSFGVKHSGELKPEQYEAVVEALDAALAETQAG